MELVHLLAHPSHRCRRRAEETPPPSEAPPSRVLRGGGFLLSSIHLQAVGPPVVVLGGIGLPAPAEARPWRLHTAALGKSVRAHCLFLALRRRLAKPSVRSASSLLGVHGLAEPSMCRASCPSRGDLCQIMRG
jgi:hypothetical protein